MAAIDGLRSQVSVLAETVARSVPGFTDHSVRHMDALWGVADEVLREDETQCLSVGEAFLLAAGFYLHDIGMALAATPAGLDKVRASEEYRIVLAAEGYLDAAAAPPDAVSRAVAYAVRRLHAKAARNFAMELVPGIDRYLLESSAIREQWGETIGEIASSHHWSLEMVDARLSKGGRVPLPTRDTADLAVVACYLRIIDYAHINRDRAPTLERVLRASIDRDSLAHWLAQESIDGPSRDGSELVYRSAKPIADVDAWWLYYGMLAGLDEEVRAVHRYVASRSASQGRFSLTGIRGASSPIECSALIGTEGFIPVDINIRAGSIERLVSLLGGESLYGPNPLVPIRELLQNSRDAVELKGITADNPVDRAAVRFPIRVQLNTKSATLEVSDYGVGMSAEVIQNYLVTIASDYWQSGRFYSDFPSAAEGGFRPAGMFGIGFISVFMVSDDVEVTSHRAGQENLRLRLRGVGRRGELHRSSPTGGSGTTVKLRLRSEAVAAYDNLASSVKAIVPMLPYDVEIVSDDRQVEVKTGWWKQLTPEQFAVEAVSIATLVTKTRRRGMLDTRMG